MTKTIKSIFLFVLMATMLMAGTVTAFAEDGVENPYIETISGASVMGTTPVIFRDTSTGMPAYCIDYNRGIPSPESLSGEFDPMSIFDADTYRGLEYLLLAGYPFETGGLSDREAQACTQLAVWCWTYETMGYGLNADNYSATSGREDIYEYFSGLMAAARNQTPPNIGIDCDNIDLIIDGDILTGTTTVTTRNLNSYELDESVLPDGITVAGYTGASGDVLTFTATLDYAGESITLDSLFTGQDTRSALNLFWYDNSNPNQQRMVISYYDESTIAVSASISLAFESIPEPTTGWINLTKTDSSNASVLLPSAVFGVYNAATDEKLGELTTDEDGTATIELPIGEVYLLEQTAPEGYKLSADRIDVTMIGGKTVEITAVNEPIPEPEPTPDPEPTDGRIKLVKKDADDSKFLSGAVFGIYRASDDVKVCELESGADGTAISPLLPAGDYYLKELTAPDSYQLSGDKHGVTVVAGETASITITNKKVPAPAPDPEPTDGKIKLIKKDADTGKLLANALFGVYRTSDDVKIGELETNSKGEAEITLSASEYYLKELKSPDKYELSKEKFGVIVKAGKVTEITITNPQISEPHQDDPAGDMLLIKKAAGTAKRLSGAVFGVYRTSDGVKLTEITTGSDGTATLSLEPGNYYCIELKAPTGFTLDSTKIPFTIKNNETVEVEVTNVPVQDAPKPDEPKPTPPVITIPKTGEAFPVMNYTLAALCMGVALYCGIKLRRRSFAK